MALDGFVVAALTHELKSELCNGRIDKVYQPETDEIILTVRSNGKNHKILLSADSNYPKIHFTTSNKENPSSPPNFCMVLRKHLMGGRIVDIVQPQFERIVKIIIESLDELNILKSKELMIEIMGKHSNIILVDSETNKIIDSIKRVPFDVSRYRQILPGLQYAMPPSQDKFDPQGISMEDFLSILKEKDQRTSLYKALYTSFHGISPLISREICFVSSIDEDILLTNLSEDNLKSIYSSFLYLMNQIKNHNFSPSVYLDEASGKYIDFNAIEISHLRYYTRNSFESVNELLEGFYLQRASKERMKQRTVDLRKSVSLKLDRLYNKLNNLNKDLDNAHESEKYKLYGDLITANIYQVPKGEEEVELINYYDENCSSITISLDKRLSPAQNAQRYFKLYSKGKTALIQVNHQIEKTQEEIHYLEQILVSIDQCTHLSDIEEIRAELEETGFIKKRAVKKGASSNQNKKSNYLKYMSSEGLEILVGKNNKQNDEITFKVSAKEDLWFHIKDLPGSHVILKKGENSPTEQSILEAATLAAYYSKAKDSSKVAVDYTARKNVKKQSGAKPGMVNYVDYSTVLVDGDERSIADIRKIDA
ncbi:Rqc2 family fibronectin-binding protein [Alkaliphilus oremlandii]|uniref:Rqc2 homolog RqcH n=1 Tax=Alkaliphilus oremlandii (strain OhILAs) TaxID=350688 RepID=A8MH76_ALKOO|nr:NFACT RNA binding domain-containing protein [Alkaliphilus oremlandii]ABW18963.1 Fibronectin-binding A domain protein [Alkaliphilus oremlandii OhILAs]